MGIDVLMEDDRLAARAEKLRDDYYAGALNLMTAHGAIEALISEHLIGGSADERRRKAAQMAMDYIKPDISGLLEAYDD